MRAPSLAYHNLIHMVKHTTYEAAHLHFMKLKCLKCGFLYQKLVRYKIKITLDMARVNSFSVENVYKILVGNSEGKGPV